MKYLKKTKREYGNYVDDIGDRYTVEWCSRIYSQDNKTPQQLGYELYCSMEEALNAWKLTPYIDPTLEEQLININEQ